MLPQIKKIKEWGKKNHSQKKSFCCQRGPKLSSDLGNSCCYYFSSEKARCLDERQSVRTPNNIFKSLSQLTEILNINGMESFLNL